ncbi:MULTISPECIES: tRNA uridine-5-carboxymethylaminomethyl(34) synthesis GTPase MnmE [Caproicibacterium]|uniref:tRNA modification GTPase MnmE n=1 Tax=Caproicibacterium argilliputei TaxID=3030016 RepID=A0AA97D9T0_9FIRM|nr:tRNA uridine-5-carboxymethylaminomethyl(34) synthesis GTPase MnmE [Caproicibacterium argilliputei]WOC32277.1 tRNA uridine-5-carboxymethylaminomethyl(34) synthesis GTPase MnmE [Caproicibacterium argilliputei]
MHTIAAISTPQAPGGIGIVRISGEQARAVAGQVFTSVSGKTLDEIPGYTSLFGTVQDADGTFDQCVAANYRAPKSYTGEDVVELSCHGGLYLLRRLLNACLAAGAVLAQPGEFTRRAFLNGKMDLTQAESVMEMISARGREAARAARAGQEGRLHDRIAGVCEILTAEASHLAAWADFPEEAVPEVSQTELHTQLNEAKDSLQSLLSGFDTGRVLREGVDTVIAGRPNVGKSTLMNLLAGCDRSIVTSYAGTTRDVVEDTILLAGIPLRLADTAGLHDTEDPVEQIGVLRSRGRVEAAQLILAVFDSSEPLQDEDRQFVELIGGTPAVAVINKNDLENKIDILYIQSKFKHIVYISALQGSGLQQLTAAVRQVLQLQAIDPAAGILFTQRQQAAAQRALTAVSEALEALESGLTLDAVTVCVEDAVSALLELTGKRVSDTVIDRVFETFCVGK